MFKPNTILAHGDVDGVASAALAWHRFSDDIKLVYFTEPFILVKVLKELERVDYPVLVLDIPAPYDLEKHYSYKLIKSNHVEPELEFVDNVELVFVDHHPDLFPSTSYMLVDWDFTYGYLPMLGVAGDNIASQLAPQDVRKDASVLAKALSTADNEFRLKVAYELMRRRKVQQIPEVVERATEFTNKLASLVEAMPLQDMVEWFDDDTCALTIPENYGDLRGFIGRIGVAIEEKLEPETLFIFWKNVVDDVSVATMRSSKLDLTRLIEKLRERDGKYVSGGGHKHAASYSSKLPLDILSTLVKMAYEEMR
jgi:hypothetical protein